MVRALLILVLLTVSWHSAQGANVWLSSSGNIAAGSTAPASLGAVQTISHQLSDTQGTFYFWMQPSASKTLNNWHFAAISSNPAVVSLSTTSVEAFNPVLGSNGLPIVRWQAVGEPVTTSIETFGLSGFNIFPADRSGIGIGPGTTSIDPFYHPGTNSWLLASVNYTLHGIEGQAAINLQIGERGLNYLGEGSAAAIVVFGATSDGALNASTQKYTDSQTPDLFINVSATPNPTADFDSDGDIDGRDFLAWQRGNGITSGASRNQGDANFDGTVNALDLGFWQVQYGQPPLTGVSTPIPEPSSKLCLFLLGSLFIFHMTWDGRKYCVRYCPSVPRRC